MGIWNYFERRKYIKQLKSPDEFDRYDAIKKLSELKDPKAVPALIEALKDKNYHVMEKAIKALGEIKDCRAIDPLVEALEYPFTERDTVLSLVSIGEPAVPALIEALKHRHYRVRMDAATALGKIGDKRAVEPLMEVVKDAILEDVRTAAAKALDRLGDERALSLFIRNLKDDRPGVRSRAANALGMLRESRAVADLIEALKDENAHVRMVASEALGKIRGARAVGALIDVSNDENRDVRAATVFSLGAMKDDVKVAPRLIEALKDEDAVVRYRAVQGMYGLRDSIVLEALIEALGDNDVFVMRESTRELVQRITNLEFVIIEDRESPIIDLKKVSESLQRCVNTAESRDGSERVKREAASAYAKIAKAVSERKRKEMGGVLSPGTVPKPSGKKGIYRMRRVMNG